MQRRSRLAWWLPRLMVVVVTIVIAFLVMEFAMRRLVVVSSSLVFTQTHQHWLEKYWTPVNSLGYRDIEWTEENLAGKTRIIVSGDSFPSGLGVNDYRDTFPQVLQSELGDDYAVMLVAEPGWGPDDIMSDLLSYPYQADAFVLSYYINDIVPACRRSTNIYKPELTRQLNPPSYLKPLVEESYLANYLYWNVYARTQMTELFGKQGEAITACFHDETAWAEHTSDLQAIYNWTLWNEMPMVVVLFSDMVTPSRYETELAQVQQFFESRHVTVINHIQEWETYPIADRIVSTLDSHPSLRIHREIGEELASLEVLRQPQNAEYQVSLETLMTPATYQQYQQYQTDFDLIPPDSLVFFPATGDPTVALFGDITNLILQPNQDLGDVFALLRVWEISEASRSQFTPEQLAAIQDWRGSKSPDLLRQADIEYLLVSELWESWLLPEEHDILYQEDNYTVVKTWQLNNASGTYRLLRVVQ